MGSISGVSRFFFLEASVAAPPSISDVGHWFQNEIVAIVLARILYINHFIVLRNGIFETAFVRHSQGLRRFDSWVH
jgi:hypothetical protein